MGVFYIVLPMGKLLKLITYSFSIILFLAIVGVAGIIAVFYIYGGDLPDYQHLKVYEPPIVTRIYANDGRMFAEYASEKRIFVPIEAIPSKVKQAFISAEDKSFYSHPGVDFLGILRAIYMNIKRVISKKRLVGASTITQQVARNFLLAETSTKVSFERKIKEAILSFRIEHAYTKDHILELYLNEIFLGNRSYGVAAAALNYFNKGLDELTTSEAAFLAALPKAPSRYHPEKNYDLALERRNWVIERLYEDGFLEASEVATAKSDPIVMRRRDAKDIVKAGFFAEEIRRNLVTLFGEKGLYENGLAVRTTMKPPLQRLANKVLRKGLVDYDRRHGWRGALTRIELSQDDITGTEWLKKLKDVPEPKGIHNWTMAVVLKLEPKRAIIGTADGIVSSIPLENLKWARQFISSDRRGETISKPSQVLSVGDVILVERAFSEDGKKQKAFHLRQIPEVSGAIVVMDPHTGRVLALTGGYSFNMSQFNRATQAQRQLGSAIKPFIYLAALEKGLNPSTIIEDAPIVIDLGWNLGVYKPKNYNDKFLGPMTLRRALELSRNTVTVRLVHEVIGVESVSEIGVRFGLYDHLPPQLAMALGAGETTLLKLTSAYAMLVNGGKRIQPTLIDRVQDRHGRTVFLGNILKCQGCGVSTWQEQAPPQLIDDRPKVTDPISAYQIVMILRGSVIRGTSRRAAVIKQPVAGKTGTSNDWKDAFYVGFSPDLTVGIYIGFDTPRTLGKDESGSRAALPLFVDFMKGALEDSPPTPFRIPSGANLIRVNPYTGERASEEDKVVILEAYKPGEGPEDSDVYTSSGPSDSSIGSGGLY